MFQKLTELFIKYNIDYMSYLIIRDIYYNESTFKDYFIANQENTVRNNIDRGTLTNIYILINNDLIEKPGILSSDLYTTDTLDKYYKKFKLTDKAKNVIKEVDIIIKQLPTAIKNTIIESNVSSQNVEKWIDDYRYIWTRGGKMLKQNAIGNKQICIEKMKSFIESYPQYNKDIILMAAKKYVDDYMIENAGNTMYLVTAPYFIKRDRELDHSKVESNTMRLADYCELMLKENITINNTLPSYGQGELA